MVNQLIYLKLLSEENTDNNPNEKIIIHLPFETVLEYKLLEQDSSRHDFTVLKNNTKILELKYMPIKHSTKDSKATGFNADIRTNFQYII